MDEIAVDGKRQEEAGYLYSRIEDELDQLFP
jgi:hypothetical protein